MCIKCLENDLASGGISGSESLILKNCDMRGLFNKEGEGLLRKMGQTVY